ncbi:MAG: hypothetical protein KatS3mg087_0871 [Patescibacteria group bacterium]|nr:MAG: hypothetical protein KatS3mg087_0871 [Patescibacteria group bacterium]
MHFMQGVPQGHLCISCKARYRYKCSDATFNVCRIGSALKLLCSVLNLLSSKLLENLFIGLSRVLFAKCKNFNNKCGEGDDKGEWDKELESGILSCGLDTEDLGGVGVVGEEGSNKE